jgi:hypothetical protein
MNRALPVLFALGILSGPTAAQAAEGDELDELRQMIETLRSDYEQRIAELERRLAVAEQTGGSGSRSTDVAAPVADTTPASSVGATVTAGNAFNPQMSVILNGNFYHDDVGGEGSALLSEAFQPSQGGHAHSPEDGHGGEDGHAHGRAGNGFNVSEAEFAFTAAVDPYVDGAAYLAIDGEGDVHLEEAWFQTRSLPYGLKLKGGKFLSDFGYINRQHPHQWDFANQNLAYLNLLGDHGLQDTGVQLTWLPGWPVYTLLGVELLQGEQERFGSYVEEDDEREELGLADRDDGPRMWTAFAKVSPDLGYEHALQLGVSYAYSRQHQQVNEHEHDHDGGAGSADVLEAVETGLEGDADLWGVDLVYKYDDAALDGHRDLKIQAEYLRSSKNLRVTGGHPEDVGSRRRLTTDGLYLQGLYGVAPRWQLGLRYDVLGLTNEASGEEGGSFGDSDRWTVALSWVPTEFSLFRLQYEYADVLVEPGLRESFNAFWLQFLLSMGSHGAHPF